MVTMALSASSLRRLEARQDNILDPRSALPLCWETHCFHRIDFVQLPVQPLSLRCLSLPFSLPFQRQLLPMP